LRRAIGTLRYLSKELACGRRKPLSALRTRRNPTRGQAGPQAHGRFKIVL